MNVCIYGAGAVGGHLAYRLATATLAQVTVVARGAHAEAMRADGLVLRHPDGREGRALVTVAAAESGDGRQDLVFVTLKTAAQAEHARQIAAWLAPHGRAVFVNNGIPWWWHAASALADKPLRALDPDNQLGRWVGSARSLGCVVYSQNEVVAPGVVQHLGGVRWILGAPDGSQPSALHEATALLGQAGLTVERVSDLRQAVWLKLLRNLALSPVAALIGQDLAVVTRQPGLMRLAESIVREVAQLAAALGWPDIEAAVPDILSCLPVTGRPSMLQDRLAGRPLELAGQLLAVQELAASAAVAMPTLVTITTLLTALESSASDG